MADGIKIRALNVTTTVKKADVLIIDKLNTITNENITYQINVNDFTEGLFINNDLNTLDNLYGVNINNPQQGDYLYYDGNVWINKQPEESTGGDFTGDAVVFNSSTEPVVFKVTVDNKTDAHRFKQANATSLKSFYINGVEAPSMILAPGRRYRFDQSDSSNTNYNLRFYSGPSHNSLTGSTPYNNPDLNDVTVFGTPGQQGAYTELHITQKIENDFLGNPYVMAETIERLFYNCLNSDGEDFMGNIINNVGRTEPDNFSSGGSPILPPLTVAEKITNLENKIEELEEHISRLIEIE